MLVYVRSLAVQVSAKLYCECLPSCTASVCQVVLRVSAKLYCECLPSSTASVCQAREEVSVGGRVH